MRRPRRQPGFTLMELMIVVTIVGILAAVAIPAFLKNARKAKTAEAAVNLKKLYTGARAYFMEDVSARGMGATPGPQFPRSVATAPALGACCSGSTTKCSPNPALWTDATWQALKFSMDDPHYYSYTYTNGAGVGTAATFSVGANGDLNCNGVYSTFEMVGSVETDGSVTGQTTMFRDKELE